MTCYLRARTWNVRCLIPQAMKLMVPVHLNRISPVMDVARQVLVVEVEGGREVLRTEVRLDNGEPLTRARVVVELRPHVVICGAVSRSFEAVLVSSGIEVFPNTCGPVEEVLAAFAAGGLTEEAFLMPGCPRRMTRRRHGGG